MPPAGRLRVLVAGGSGMIGSAVTRGLLQAGHEVVHAGRNAGGQAGTAGGLRLDFNALPPAAELVRQLQGFDVLVNAVGIFQPQAEQSFDAVHVKGVAGLFAAAVEAGVGRLVHVSALGAAPGADTAYFSSKGQAEAMLRELPGHVTIVRPSLVFSPDGASTRFFARLASAPVLPLPRGGGQQVQPVHVDDLAQAIVRIATGVVPAPAVLDAVGPRPLPLREYLTVLGKALARAPRIVALPRVAETLLPLAARATGGLVSRDALRMLEAGSTADPAGMAAVLGRRARDPSGFVDAQAARALAARLRTGQAVLCLRLALAMMWLGTAWVSLWGYPRQDSLALLARLDLHGGVADLALWSGALLDAALGLAMLVLPRRRRVYLAQLLLMAGYTVLISLWLPEFWLHPFGPLLKNIPVAAAIIALILLDRDHGPGDR